MSKVAFQASGLATSSCRPQQAMADDPLIFAQHHNLSCHSGRQAQARLAALLQTYSVKGSPQQACGEPQSCLPTCGLSDIGHSRFAMEDW